MKITACYSQYLTIEVPDIPMDKLDQCTIEDLILENMLPPPDTALTYISVDMGGKDYEWYL